MYLKLNLTSYLHSGLGFWTGFFIVGMEVMILFKELCLWFWGCGHFPALRQASLMEMWEEFEIFVSRVCDYISLLKTDDFVKIVPLFWERWSGEGALGACLWSGPCWDQQVTLKFLQITTSHEWKKRYSFYVSIQIPEQWQNNKNYFYDGFEKGM